MNRKGITTVELLICFILVMIITISMYTVISAYNERRILESYKEQIVTYKNTITKDIQDDLIKVGLTAATYERKVVNSTEGVPVKAVYTVDFDLRDGTQRQLVIEQTTTKSSYHPAGYDASSGAEVDDAYLIKYGDPTPDASGKTPNMVEYDFPDLGGYTSKETGMHALDFSINNVLINIYDEKVLSIYIGFYHPEFGTRYFIDITALIDFTFSGAEFVDASRVAYFIIYNLDGGTYPGGTNPNLIAYDQTRLPYTLINPIKTGKTFTGWTGSNGTDPKTTVKLLPGTTGNKSYTANWRDNYAYIHYTVNGETVHSPYTTENGTVHYYTTVNNRIYTTNASGGNQQIIQPSVVHGGKLSSSGLANYDGIGNSYFNITLNGYSPVSGAQWACNCTAGATGCPCARQTYDWGVAYTAAQLCNTNEADCVIELHPNWNRVDYTITYNYNNGALPRGVTNPDKYNIDTATITLNNPSRTGYNFSGWTGSNGSTAQTTVTIPKGSTGNKSYTANWSAISYPITYDYAGGSVSPANPSSYTIASADITLRNPTRSYYDFNGWTGSNGTTAQTTVTITSGSTGAKSYTAHWSEHGYSITYTLNDGALASGVTNPSTYTYNSAAITLNNPSKAGHTFTGWTGSNGTTPQTTVTIPKGSYGNKSYTANWSKNQYTITYHAGTGGSGTMAKTTCYYNDTCTFATNKFTRDNYIFAGWFTLESGGTKYGSSTKLTKNIDVYAHWGTVAMPYDYTGGVQTFEATTAGRYKLEVWGAQGGTDAEYSGGYGGYAVGYVDLTENQILYVFVGGQGGNSAACAAGGYNGGGNAGCTGTSGGGGGATHISKTNTILSSTSVGNLFIVAGGGGGAGHAGGDNTPGGSGGGSSGTSKSGGGGSQTKGGSGTNSGAYGVGGSRNGDGGGGGGGYYGGGAATSDHGGGGGSGYTGGVSSGSMSNGAKSGNGYARISYAG